MAQEDATGAKAPGASGSLVHRAVAQSRAFMERVAAHPAVGGVASAVRRAWAAAAPVRARLASIGGVLLRGLALLRTSDGREWSVGGRLSLVAGAVVAAVLGVIALVASQTSAGALAGKAEHGLGASTDAVMSTLAVYREGLDGDVSRMFGAFLGTLPQASITRTPEERYPAGGRDAPALRFEDVLLNADTTIVDDFTSNTQAAAVVFVLDGEELVQVASSLLDESGNRTLGETLPTGHPAFEKVMAGEPFTGPESLHGSDYIVHYEPIFSASGTSDDEGGVIGAMLVGIRYDTALEALAEKLKDVDLGDGGRLVVLQRRGDEATLVVHPKLAGTPLSGEGADPAAAPLAAAFALPDGSHEVDLPTWSDGGSVRNENHLVALRTFEPCGWRRMAQVPEAAVAADATALGWRIVLLSVIGALVIAMAVAWLARRLVALPLARAVEFAGAVAGGDLDARPEEGARAELGALNRALGDMTGRLRERQDVERRAAEEMKRLADEASAIANALDAASSAVMMTDPGHAIRYANRAMRVLLRVAAPVLSEAVPDFRPDDPIGLDFERFHPMGVPKKGPIDVETVFGGRTFRLEISPWFDQDDAYRGSVVTWTERTAQIAVQREVQEVVSAAAAGDLSTSIPLEGKQGFLRDLAASVNDLIAATRAGVTEVQTVLAALAEGDLTVRSEAELRGVFATMRDDANTSTERLAEVIAAIRDAAHAITTASSEIAAGNLDLSSRTEQQAASLEETASSMEELTATVKQNAEVARQAASLSGGAAQVAIEGGRLVDDVVGTMTQIQASSKKISDIVGTINGIAFQTNILAINAAVEAARAGESGRGFAVVASEVRSLAQRTADASKEIRAIIEESNKRIGAGAALAGKAGSTMHEVVGSVKRVTDLIEEISAASMEQSQGIEQVNQTIAQIDETTQQNAALVEEASAAARATEEQAADLVALVERFRLEDGGEHA
ncbi:MAG: methyl-accepting chemotaxis protein [Lysobacteraceae bacterium]